MNDLLKNYFGITPIDIKKLNGYDNFNYLIKSSSNTYVLKTYSNSKMLAFIKAETEALIFLNSDKSFKSPIPVKFLDGSYVRKIRYNDEEIIVRLLSYLNGDLMGDVPGSESISNSLGAFLAKLDLRLQSWNNQIIKSRSSSEWNLDSFSVCEEYIPFVESSRDRSYIKYFFQQYNFEINPISEKLRKSIIHNDANEYNLIVKNNCVNGIIDFGDISFSDLINELAIAIVYNSYREDNYLTKAEQLICSYNKILPINEFEIKALYYKIALRLCISACNSAKAKKFNPNNNYISHSETKILKMLRGWIKINPYDAENRFRKACGLNNLKPSTISSLISKRKKNFSSNLSLSYNNPIYFKKAAFQYMYDEKGRTFLDAYNNIPHVGHCHPKTILSSQRQMSKLNTNTRYLYDSLYSYTENLLSKFPKNLNKVFFVNSGSEASDLAVRMAKWHTRKDKIVVIQQGYHGHTQIGIEISDYKFNNIKGIGKQNHIIRTPIPASNMRIKNSNDYIDGFDNQLLENENQIALFISETILGCAGQVCLPKNFLKNIYSKIRKQGGVCIADEVQTGFGRTGDNFWAYEDQEVVPDIVILGKPMANGHPMGAVITSEEISSSFEEGVEFFSSFGGNPVSCEIANSVLDIMDEEKLQQNAKKVGDYYKKSLTELSSFNEHIGEIRGKGLFLGIEIINRDQSANSMLAQQIKNELKDKLILVGTDGEKNNIIKTKPPLCFEKQNVDHIISELDKILRNS